MTLTFDNPAGALWLIASAAVALLGVGAALWRRRAAARFADAALLPRIAPGLSLSRGIWRATLLGGSAACLAAALMDPRASEQTEELTRRGADVMFVVDVSRSMLAEDATPNRLERARTFIADAIDAMGGDRAGLIDFAGVAAVRAPLTLNYDALKAAVDSLETKDSRRGGSMLGDAIRLAAESFPTDDAGHAIVILSDGEDMGSDPMDAAKQAAERGIRIITVGIGDPREGARIPVGDGPNRRFLVHDGEEVWSRMDSATLRDVADATGGLFVPAGTAQVELGEILARSLGDLERTEGDSSVAKTTAPLFQWPAGFALALLAIESLISARARRAPLAAYARTPAANSSGPAVAPPAPRRRRRARQQPAAARAMSATIAAVAALAGASTAARADDSASATRTAPSASRATIDTPAGADSAGDARAAASAPKRTRAVGRGQIDRAAFHDAITRANAAMQAGQYTDAAAAFADAVQADPTSAAAAYNRGVAEYRAGKLDDAATSFAEAASRGDAALAADAMFNQGNAIYQGALRALEGGAAGADPSGAGRDPAATSPAQPDLKAATDAVQQALTHYKDAIAADPADVDSRANAELAHTLLKQLREMQKQQEQQQQKQDEQDRKDSSDQSQQDTQPPQDQQKQGEQSDNPQDGKGQQKEDGQGAEGTGSESEPKDPSQPKDSQKKDPADGATREDKTQDPKDSAKEGQQPQDQGKGKDGKDTKEPEPSDSSDAKSQADGSDGAKDASKPEGEVKARSGAEQPKSDQQPPAPAQARAGEPVPGAPLTKSESERLLQGVRDRAKQRMEAKERAERVRQLPAPRDW